MRFLEYIKVLLSDHHTRTPRNWSNREIEVFAPLFGGEVVNVSAWRDADKEGKRYKDYFTKASRYWVTNYKAEARGWQGDLQDELFLDLENDLPADLRARFDVVFNHTTLEHVFDVFKAVENLCLMSRDIVMLVVPFLQEQHGDYGDYWRFTPWCLKRLFEKNGLDLLYISDNGFSKGVVYVFAIASRHPEKWAGIRNAPRNLVHEIKGRPLGFHSIRGASPLRTSLRSLALRVLRLTKLFNR